MLEYECDVAILGGGLSGLITALRAAQHGRKVLVFEKGSDEHYLCASRLTAGVLHICMTDVRQDPATLTGIINDRLGEFASPSLVRMMAEGAMPGIRWLQENGVSLIKGAADYQAFMLAPPNIVRVGASWLGKGGDLTLQRLESRLLAAGGHVLRGHEVDALVADSDAPAGMTGRAGDDTFTVLARAVVLADGGFQSNLDLLQRGISSRPADILQRNARQSLGTALRLAEGRGAAIAYQGFYGHVQARDALENEKLWPYPWLDDLLQVGLIVNVEGRRFADEGLGGVHVANAIARLPDPLSAVVVFDNNIWETAGRMRGLSPNPNLQAAGAVIHKANSLDELAAKAGLPAGPLLETVAQHNSSVATGVYADRTTDVGTPKPVALAKGPYYAVPACAGITYTMGGPKIDDSCRILNSSGEPLQGLFAVGSASGGVEGGPKPGYVGGLIKAVVTGLRAGDSVARA